jgi:hypothetical protein
MSPVDIVTGKGPESPASAPGTVATNALSFAVLAGVFAFGLVAAQTEAFQRAKLRGKAALAALVPP